MRLSASQLEAFHAVAETLHFSRAARRLRLTQPALSKRVQLLEEELRTPLFLRSRAGVRLTEAGERLLRHCRVREALEDELRAELRATATGDKAGLSGMLRVGGISSIIRPLVVPALATLLRRNRGIVLHISVRESRELPSMLRSGEVDYAVVDQVLERSDVEQISLGAECNVLVEPVRLEVPDDVYLDHDPEDTTTERFLRLQKQRSAGATRFERLYLDDIHGILDGVALGLGRAVVPRHMIAREKRVREVKGSVPLLVPIALAFPKQPFFTKLHEEVVAAVLAGCDVLERR